MTETPMPDSQPPLTKAQQLRFEQDVPQWLAGQLCAEDAAWMDAMLQRSPALDAQLQWHRQLRDLIREEAAQENTDDAWAMLAQRMAQDARDAEPAKDVKTQQHRAAPAWLRWLLDHPGWANACAVADAEVGAAVDDWLARGAHVLVVMDTCYAASTTRAFPADTLRWRGLKVAELDALQPAQAAAVDMAHGLPGVLPAPRPRTHGYVGIYACEHMQRTPEWAIAGQHQGAFTHALTQALREAASGHSYAALCMRALDVHGALLPDSQVDAAQWPSPVFEGSLQAPLWTSQALPSWQARNWSKLQRTAQSVQGLELLLEIERPGSARPQRIDLLQQTQQLDLGQLPVGTRFRLQVRNALAQPWYLRFFY